jgi:hypothetical protein
MFFPRELLEHMFQFQVIWRFDRVKNQLYRLLPRTRIENFDEKYKKITKPTLTLNGYGERIAYVYSGRYWNYEDGSSSCLFGFCYFSEIPCFRFHFKDKTYFYYQETNLYEQI